MPPVISYAQSGEDLLIAFYVGRREAVTYIDVGCLWPVEHSSTYFFYERSGHGLCIDANPDVQADWAHERPRDRFVCSGIAAHESKMAYHRFRNPVFNTFSEERAQAVAARGEERPGRRPTEVVDVPVRTLDTTVAETGFAEAVEGRLDVLSIDVEGLEEQVVRGFSFGELRPRLVVAERHRRGSRRTMPADDGLVAALAERGYRLAGHAAQELYFLDERTAPGTSR